MDKPYEESKKLDEENEERTQLNPKNINGSPIRSGSSMKKKKFKTPTTKSQFTITREPKKTTLLSVTRLQIPNSSKGYQRLDNSPLLNLESDSDDELFLSSYGTPSANSAGKQINRQLQKDGYRLDEMPDDEELDLIPPSDFRQGGVCTCCNGYNVSCVIS